MMYMHYCPQCNRIHMLNGHKCVCPGCDSPLTELAISFLEFTDMDADERDAYLERCGDETQLGRLRAVHK